MKKVYICFILFLPLICSTFFEKRINTNKVFEQSESIVYESIEKEKISEIGMNKTFIDSLDEERINLIIKSMENSQIYYKKYKDDLIDIYLMVIHLGKGKYLASVDIEWLDMPDKRGIDVIDMSASPLIDEFNSGNGWHSYQISYFNRFGKIDSIEVKEKLETNSFLLPKNNKTFSFNGLLRTREINNYCIHYEQIFENKKFNWDTNFNFYLTYRHMNKNYDRLLSVFSLKKTYKYVNLSFDEPIKYKAYEEKYEAR